MNSRISDTRRARKNIFLCEEGDARVAYFVAGNFTRAGIFCSLYYPREKWGTCQSRPVKQTNQRTNQSSNYVCSCRRTGAKRGKNRGNVTILPLIGGGCFARLGHSIENYYTGRRYIRHWLPTPHLDTITFNPLCHRLIPWGKGVESS